MIYNTYLVRRYGRCQSNAAGPTARSVDGQRRLERELQGGKANGQ